VLLLVGLIALLAPPNTFDSMTYHMSRVAHWAHQGSVAPYPTHIVRQITAPPLAEFAILQLQLLSGGDRLANLVQFFALCGCVLNVSLIAARLRAGPRGQILAAVACGVLLGRQQHADHHSRPYDRRYCITTGWCNRPLDAIAFFRRMERTITALTGVSPRHDDRRYEVRYDRPATSPDTHGG